MIVIAGRVRVQAAEKESAVQAGSVMAGGVPATEQGCGPTTGSGSTSRTPWSSTSSSSGSRPKRSRPTSPRLPHFVAFAEVIARVVDGPTDLTRYEVSSAGPLFG